MAEISDLIGLTMAKVEGTAGDTEITFVASNGDTYRMLHLQDCCESVRVEDIAGDLQDLVDTPITMAREDSNSTDDPAEDHDDSYTWTFYNLGTVKGQVNIRWFGTSNGYYSESVDLIKD